MATVAGPSHQARISSNTGVTSQNASSIVSQSDVSRLSSQANTCSMCCRHNPSTDICCVTATWLVPDPKYRGRERVRRSKSHGVLLVPCLSFAAAEVQFSHLGYMRLFQRQKQLVLLTAVGNRNLLISDSGRRERTRTGPTGPITGIVGELEMELLKLPCDRFQARTSHV